MNRSFVRSVSCAALLLSACGGASSSSSSSSTTPTASHTTLTRWQDETIGPLRLGMTEAEVISAIGEPTTRSRFENMEGTGEGFADWSWPALGVLVGMQNDGGPRVASIVLRAPCTYVTGHGGLGIGSSYADVVAAYADVPAQDDEEPRSDPADHSWVRLGDPYEALSFQLENDRVTAIFFGSTGAE